ncbi:hypothetical protein B0H67DRAFT_682645 [Lasiosphaeris hirsuta]|uniref:Uncharacterized protein n=1 Tax=Lasiosphaeris hirsuta TaxID=260670 RepID=A0AA40E328_9PEZI|nr:hypothetical protein B0H67DRAFT_682645 [Lasiosphaeris hirsuta]
MAIPEYFGRIMNTGPLARHCRRPQKAGSVLIQSVGRCEHPTPRFILHRTECTLIALLMEVRADSGCTTPNKNGARVQKQSAMTEREDSFTSRDFEVRPGTPCVGRPSTELSNAQAQALDPQSTSFAVSGTLHLRAVSRIQANLDVQIWRT